MRKVAVYVEKDLVLHFKWQKSAISSLGIWLAISILRFSFVMIFQKPACMCIRLLCINIHFAGSAACGSRLHDRGAYVANFVLKD